MIEINKEDWIKKGKELFGDNVQEWKFVCPICKETQTCQEFFDNNVESATQKFYSSCIGRWVDGRGCDDTLGGGLFGGAKTAVVGGDGSKIPVFEFYREQE